MRRPPFAEAPPFSALRFYPARSAWRAPLPGLHQLRHLGLVYTGRYSYAPRALSAAICSSKVWGCDRFRLVMVMLVLRVLIAGFGETHCLNISTGRCRFNIEHNQNGTAENSQKSAPSAGTSRQNRGGNSISCLTVPSSTWSAAKESKKMTITSFDVQAAQPIGVSRPARARPARLSATAWPPSPARLCWISRRRRLERRGRRR